ncbi:MAG: hypothetical protein ACK58N_02930 [Synechocystis sp.]
MVKVLATVVGRILGLLEKSLPWALLKVLWSFSNKCFLEDGIEDG